MTPRTGDFMTVKIGDVVITKAQPSLAPQAEYVATQTQADGWNHRPQRALIAEVRPAARP